MNCSKEKIEPGIMDQVHLLHNNGFNTICYSAHDHSIQLELAADDISR